MSAIYPHIAPNIESWPIFKLSEKREAFVNEIVSSCLASYKDQSTDDLEEMLSKTIFTEIKRCKENPWKVDPSNEVKYWRSLRKEMDYLSSIDDPREKYLELSQRILNRYAQEILGSFKVSTFKRARRVLSSIFRRLLNSASGKYHRRLWGSKYQLYERLIVKGPLEKVRSLAKKGTVIMVPTHFSNLDSILIGYAVDSIMGLPAFHYGAGLNLYDLELVAYFINRLGAYKVDRRKKNVIYLDTLKKMSLLSIERGVHSLFFPRGTRSRNGALESEVKMGLLGTVVEAQRSRLQKGNNEKIFVVPLVLSYHFVLESKFLIESYLKRKGQEQYLGSKDAAKSYSTILRFLWDLFAQGSEIYLTLGEPLDVIGNHVDENGKSFDKQNREVELNQYFSFDNELQHDPQREYVYTKLLGQEIVKSYHRYNTVLSSHVVAFTLYMMIAEKYPDENIFGLLSKDAESLRFPYEVFRDRIQSMQKVLISMNNDMQLNITNVIQGPPDTLIETGIRNMNTYHVSKPVKIGDDNTVYTEDFKLLYYYRNRLDQYELETKVKKKIEELNQA